PKAQGQFMKEVAILLLVALMLNGCSNSTAVQTAVSGGWQGEMLSGDGFERFELSISDPNRRRLFSGDGGNSDGEFEGDVQCRRPGDRHVFVHSNVRGKHPDPNQYFGD